ncbi:DUF6804 family protein [Leucobacter manosquensis]|uniref:Uncharacterized protein n=1 Tax=Leucobacter manosquensis TaxID=2810611 RepID=A0ABS5M8D6_9MICO|nr:DUF6804 family protein [Leucobacter manosquensis]MBS3183464.1 hypothetical protein [Leucobacter manosquensis]
MRNNDDLLDLLRNAKPNEPKSFLERRPALLPLIVVAVFALIAVLDLPYGYYQFFRVWVHAACVLIIVHAVRAQKPGWSIVGVIVSVTFFVGATASLPQTTWMVIDVIVAVVFIFSGCFIPEVRNTKTESGKPRWPWWGVTLLIAGLFAIPSIMGAFNSDANDTVYNDEYDYEDSCGFDPFTNDPTC